MSDVRITTVNVKLTTTIWDKIDELRHTDIGDVSISQAISHLIELGLEYLAEATK